MRLRRPGGLWLHRDFRNLWAAETVSVFGTQISQLALPLVAVITLEASVFEVALLGVIEFAPFILISLPAGVWVDRMRRKPILVTADVGRALLLASIPIAYWLDALTIWQMYVVGFAVGVLTVFFDVSYQSYLPSLVDRQQLVEGNSKLEISRSAAQLAGPGLAGILVEAVKAPGAVLVDAISFALSAFYLFRIKAEERAPTRAERQAGPGMKQEVKEGLRWVFGNRYLRWIAASTATFNFFANIIFSVYLVYAVRVLHIRPGVLGLVFAVSSIGYLVGALAANRLSRRFGVGPTIILGAAGSVSLLLLAVAPTSNPIPFLIAAQAISSMGIPIYNITQVSFRQAITPERLQGRMNSVMRFIVWGVMPLGALIGRCARLVVRPSHRDLGRRDRDVARGPAGAALTRADAARDAGAGRRAAAVGGRGSRRARPRRGRSGAWGASRLTAAALYRSAHARATRGRGVGARARSARVGRARAAGGAGAHRDAEDIRPAAPRARGQAFRRSGSARQVAPLPHRRRGAPTARPPDERRPDPASRRRRQGAEDPRVPAPLRERRRARADRGRAEEAGRRLARVAGADRGRARPSRPGGARARR